MVKDEKRRENRCSSMHDALEIWTQVSDQLPLQINGLSMKTTRTSTEPRRHSDRSEDKAPERICVRFNMEDNCIAASLAR